MSVVNEESMWFDDMKNTICQSITGELPTTHHVREGGEGDNMCCVIQSAVFPWLVINLKRCADRQTVSHYGTPMDANAFE